jgi:virulence-associated protein VagC
MPATMTVADIFRSGDYQAVRLPPGFEFDAAKVVIRRAGKAVILEPIKQTTWPNNFFERIRIEDPAFQRPKQGAMPIAPDFDLS